MKITSFFALSAFALLSIPAVAQQPPPNPPTPTEDHIILLDEVEAEMQGARAEIDAARLELDMARMQMDSVRVMMNNGEFQEIMRNAEITMDSVRIMMNGLEQNFDFDMDMNMNMDMNFDSNDEADSPEETKREELRDRYEQLRDETKKVQRELRERQRELRTARRNGSADTTRISAGISEAQASLTSAQQSLETFQTQYGDQLGSRRTAIAPRVRFRYNTSDTAAGSPRQRVIIRNRNGNDAMHMAPMPPMPPMPPMAPMPPMTPMAPMPPMPPMPPLDGALSRGGHMMHFNGDTMMVGNGRNRRVIIICDSAEGHSDVVINNGPAVANRRRIEKEVRMKPAPTAPSNKGYALEDAVPNPFDERAKISFTMPTAGRATLTVFNEAGEVIRRLVDQEMAAGAHTIEFDGTGLATGIYLYQLVAGSFSETKSMRLVR